MGETQQLLKEFAQNILNGLTTMGERKFHEGSVPAKVAARVYQKNPSWVRAGIIAGWLPIGIATRDGKQITDVKEMDSKEGRINYFISPKLFYEHTGYLWEGEQE